MGRKILFSPIGTTDPIKNYRDGSMLHICRVYQPDEIYLYLSAEMLEYHRRDDRYVFSIRKLEEKMNKDIKIHIIEREDLFEVQEYDIFYDDFRELIAQISSSLDTEDKLFVNISSGSPAMKSALLILAVLAEYRFKPIQVRTPLRKSNIHKDSPDEFDPEIYWELNEDNAGEFENRCVETKSRNFSKLLKIDSIKKFVKAYDYDAACILTEELREDLPDKTYRFIQAANARLKLDAKSLRKFAKEDLNSIIPVQGGDQWQIMEYALALGIKLRKGELADFIRGITPLFVDLTENILKRQCNIDIKKYCRKVDGVWKYDRRKITETELYTRLAEEYEGSFRFGPLKSNDLVCLICEYSQDKKLNKKISDMREIERTVRNQAAHEIVSVTDDWIKKQTGYGVEQIYSLLKYLIGKAGIRITDEAWASYDAMNVLILRSLE